MFGLILEGGASRTVYSCGILDAFLENDIMADRIYAVSAGAAFGVSYASGQKGRNYRLATEFMGTKKYMAARHLIDPRNRSYYNLKYAFDDVPNIHLPFDYDAFGKNPAKFFAVVTNVETGEAEYLPVGAEDREWQVLRATCALPLLFPEIEIDGKKYMDGGIADSIPIERAIEEGCDRIVVILTRPRDYRKVTDSTTRLAAGRYKKHPEFAEALLTRAERYNSCVDRIHELRRQGKVFVFTPRSAFGVGRIEGDPKKLDRLYRHGYEHANWAMEELKKYLKG
ncbi:MAG: patatin family protein [Ruminococcus sp.]|nr:patatin family protein [Ruminococcus sp.]